MNIKTKLVLTFLILSLVPLFFVEVLAIKSIENAVISQVIDELRLETDLRKSFLDETFRDLEWKVKTLKETDVVKDSLFTLINTKPSKDSTLYKNTKNVLDKHLVPWLEATPGALDLLITDEHRQIVYASNPKREKKELGTILPDRANHRGYENREAHEMSEVDMSIVHFSDIIEDSLEEDVFEMVVDVRINDNSGTFIGFIAFEVDVNYLYEAILKENQLGESGESYLVNANHTMISPSRFLEGVILKQEVDTLVIKQCFGSSEEIARPLIAYPDYRGINVYGAGDHIAKTDWCLVSEIDADEAMITVRTLESVIFIFISVATLLVALFAFLAARSISSPITKLTVVANDISKGKFDATVDAEILSDEGEIGDLARAFDRTVASLKLAMMQTGEMKAEKTESPTTEPTPPAETPNIEPPANPQQPKASTQNPTIEPPANPQG